MAALGGFGGGGPMLLFAVAGPAVEALPLAVAGAGVAVGTSAVRSCSPLEWNSGAALQHSVACWL